MKKTKVMCTLGHSCESVEIIKDMIKSGMNLARISVNHGLFDKQLIRVKNLRKAAEELGTYIPILLDLQGPEMRIGRLKEQNIEIIEGRTLVIITNPIIGDANKVSVNYKELPSILRNQSRILIDEGLIEVSVKDIIDNEIICTVIRGGILKHNADITLPGIRTTLPGLTQTDIKYIDFGIKNNIEMIAVSFARKANDIKEIRNLLANKKANQIQIISKIENEEGLSNLEEIADVSDGLMVARGDLGVDMPLEDIPYVQQQIVEKCYLLGKPVIIATHMLHSMKNNPRPTRAEVTDVTVSVLQGVDILMLSETSSGKYPTETVKQLCSIIKKTENIFDDQMNSKWGGIEEKYATAAVSLATILNASAIIVICNNMNLVNCISKRRPPANIIVFTCKRDIYKNLILMRGVTPIIIESISDFKRLKGENITDLIEKNMLKNNIIVTIEELDNNNSLFYKLDTTHINHYSFPE
ncbi:pyruvate kinase [Paenibacillus gansuensis]|uniref:Pyruvate kinase n=1 Tax=Paenibacillus gansuensis TaxID=306542 RepID=A0ABW5PIV3_9BACL